MTDKFINAWSDIENAIGTCCLHKKAAFREISGKGLQQLSLVTTASPESIREFIGKRNVDESQPNRFIFSHEGIQIDLTTFADEDDIDRLFVKSFRHTLTIDSIGMTRSGEISNIYHGVEDAHNKILRLTDENAVISEMLFRRILQLIYNESFKIDDSVKLRLDKDKVFEKESYRKKFCEVLVTALKSPKTDWKRIAELLDILGGCIGHRKAIVNYTRNISDNKDDAYKRTFAFLIFALLKVTSKEIQPLYNGDPAIGYFDSLCSKLYKLVETYSEFKELKEKYGTEFMEMLFDMQELWMSIENVPYRRPTEKDFDRMALLIADKRFWKSDAHKSEQEQCTPKIKEQEVFTESHNDIQDEDRSFELEGSFDFNKAMNGKFNREDYEEPTEGVVVDTYTPEDEKASEEAVRDKSEYTLGDLDMLDSETANVPISKKHKDGFYEKGLDEYESMEKREVTPQVVQTKTKTNESIPSRAKGHKMIMGK